VGPDRNPKTAEFPRNFRTRIFNRPIALATAGKLQSTSLWFNQPRRSQFTGSWLSQEKSTVSLFSLPPFGISCPTRLRTISPSAVAAKPTSNAFRNELDAPHAHDKGDRRDRMDLIGQLSVLGCAPGSLSVTVSDAVSIQFGAAPSVVRYDMPLPGLHLCNIATPILLNGP
jgi:hypothetical protein